MGKRKRVLFVINTLGRAGAERALLELLRRLSPTQYEISLYVMLKQGDLLGELPSHVTLLNKDFKEISVLSEEGRRTLKRTVVRSFFHNGRLPYKIKCLCENFLELKKGGGVTFDKLFWRMISDGADAPTGEYDLAVAYLEGASTYFVADHVRAAKKAAFVHIDYAAAGYTRKMGHGCYACFDRIFAVSDEERESFLKVYPEYGERTKVFHNLIDRGGIIKKSGEAGGFSDSYDGARLLTVGRLTLQKAYDVAIAAMRLLKERGVAARWYVLGDGDLRGDLERQIRNLGLEEDFILLGAVENPYPYYRQCDVYVHATRFEGKSIAVQEAQILGCAIVASDCSGNREQVVDGVDGVLCPLTAEGIADAVEDLISDKEERVRLGEAAARKVAGDEAGLNLLLDLLA